LLTISKKYDLVSDAIFFSLRDRRIDLEKNEVIVLRDRIEKILDGLLFRNESLYNLVLLLLYFNDIEWMLKVAQMDKKLKRKYPIEEIMFQIECSKRSAYDYSNALEALDMCNRLSSAITNLLFTSAISGKLKRK
jgi:hypothetical protein